jgi:hypothetical protein
LPTEALEEWMMNIEGAMKEQTQLSLSLRSFLEDKIELQKTALATASNTNKHPPKQDGYNGWPTSTLAAAHVAVALLVLEEVETTLEEVEAVLATFAASVATIPLSPTGFVGHVASTTTNTTKTATLAGLETIVAGLAIIVADMVLKTRPAPHDNTTNKLSW